MYRCVATSVAGFIQQLAVSYIGNGYWFWVAGEIPEGKEPDRTDRKIVDQYGIGISKWTRARGKKAGMANLHYLRHERFFVIIATSGRHEFFEAEANRIADVRRRPIYFHGHSIGCRREWGRGRLHASVRIERKRYLEVKAYFEDLASHRSTERLVAEFQALPFERYAPVRNQLWMILRAVNRVRKMAGWEMVPREAIWKRRRPVKPFGDGDGVGQGMVD